MIVAVAAMLLTGQVYADPNQLAKIDRAFVCPENLPNKHAKLDALEKFDADMSKAVKDLTVEKLSEGRLYLLRKHHCYTTLRNIERTTR